MDEYEIEQRRERCREKYREQARKRWAANPELARQRYREWRTRNLERVRKRERERYHIRTKAKKIAKALAKLEALAASAQLLRTSTSV